MGEFNFAEFNLILRIGPKSAKLNSAKISSLKVHICTYKMNKKILIRIRKAMNQIPADEEAWVLIVVRII